MRRVALSEEDTAAILPKIVACSVYYRSILLKVIEEFTAPRGPFPGHTPILRWHVRVQTSKPSPEHFRRRTTDFACKATGLGLQLACSDSSVHVRTVGLYKAMMAFVGGLNDMFDSLDEQMKHDIREQQSGKERMLIYTAVAIVSVVVFVGLYFAVRMME